MQNVDSKLVMQKIREYVQENPSHGLGPLNQWLGLQGMKASGKMLGLARREVLGPDAITRRQRHYHGVGPVIPHKRAKGMVALVESFDARLAALEKAVFG